MKKLLGPSPMLFPMPAVLIGTYDDDGTPNAMTAAWAAACSHKPPCLGVAVRSSRLTFVNIGARGAFTINVPGAELAADVDYLGLVSGRKVPDKLARAGLSTHRATLVDAPVIERCKVVAECRLHSRLELGSHTWFVGEVLEVQVEEELVGGDGKVIVDCLDPLAYVTSEAHYRRIGADLGAAYDIGKRPE
jgi:flavin reductase (DIM6/NTAB) family NADH-FMN oxidoreductase RutF